MIKAVTGRGLEAYKAYKRHLAKDNKNYKKVIVYHISVYDKNKHSQNRNLVSNLMNRKIF